MKRQDLKIQLKKSANAQKAIVREIQEDYKYVDAEEFNKIP